MYSAPDSLFTKLSWSLPWLARYPFWRVGEILRRVIEPGGRPLHLIFIVADHFEPSWHDSGILLDLPTQLRRLDDWCVKARKIAADLHDADGTPFRHTYFFPAEQYHAPVLALLAELQREGLGEVETHLHHGVDKPDTPENTRRALLEFRDKLAEEHKCLSRWEGQGPPMYAFVHGNWALANSAGGRFCGVDNEMQILSETGCYADFTLPSAPDRSQQPRLNAIYQCGHSLEKARPHRSGPALRVGQSLPTLPIIFTGPLTLNWRRLSRGVPIPRLDDAGLAANYPLDRARLRRWLNAHITIRRHPEWVFIKLYCHGFFDHDQRMTIGDELRRFLSDTMERGASSGAYKVHFATAREAFNIALAAVDGHAGEPNKYRDYRLRLIMRETESKRDRKEAPQHAHPNQKL